MLIVVRSLLLFREPFFEAIFTPSPGVCFASDAMNVRDEYRLKAAEFRDKADSQRDPLFRSMFETLARTYLRLARYHERDYRPKLAFRPSPPIAVVDPPKRRRRRAKKAEIESGT